MSDVEKLQTDCVSGPFHCMLFSLESISFHCCFLGCFKYQNGALCEKFFLYIHTATNKHNKTQDYQILIMLMLKLCESVFWLLHYSLCVHIIYGSMRLD